MQTLKSIGKSFWSRINNKGTFLAIVGFVISLLIESGVQVNSDKVMGIVQVISTLLIALGVLNDPTQNSKPYIPGISDKLAENSSKIEEPQKSTDEVAAEKSSEVSNVKIPVAEEGILKDDLITNGVLNTEVKEEIKTEEQQINQEVK